MCAYVIESCFQVYVPLQWVELLLDVLVAFRVDWLRVNRARDGNEKKKLAREKGGTYFMLSFPKSQRDLCCLYMRSDKH
jgi:hypothetical protein